MEIDVYRSYIVNLKEQDIYLVLDSSMLLAKNVYNSSMFLLHNLIYSYDYDKDTKTYTIKQHLHSNQIETIEFFNHVIKQLNSKRLKKFNKKEKPDHNDQSIDISNKEKEFVPLLELTSIIDIKSFRTILLDKTLLENIVKHKENVKPEFVDFRKIPSVVAQYAAHKAVDDINVYFKTLAAYFKSFQVGQKANIPQLPRYLGKNDRLTIELSNLRFGARNHLFKINPKKHTLYNYFYNKTQSIISNESIQNFNQFNLKQAIDDALNKRINKQDKDNKKNIDKNLEKNIDKNLENKKDFTLQTIRFVPHKLSGKGKNKYNLKVEAIVSIKETISEDSSLAKIITYYNNNKPIYKKPTSNFEQLPSNTQQKVIIDYVKDNPEEFINLLGCDMGMNNILALAFTHGKNQIYSATHINRELTKLNIKLDRLKSEVFKTLLTPELLVKVLENRITSEQNKDIIDFNKNIAEDNEKLELLDKEKLTLEELKSIKSATSFLYDNKNYQKTLIKLENYKKNILHQLSEQVVSHCIKNKTQCLVIGQNKNWKQELNMGKRNNRLFLSLPHSLLIEQIQYKALAKGIVVITTEESYTSQASFINADEIPVYSKKEKNSKVLNSNNIVDLNNTTVVDTEKNHSHEICKVQSNISNTGVSNNSIINNTAIKTSKSQRFSGTRKKHSYNIKKKIISKMNKNNPIKIHSDINGAFNIICKVFENFRYYKSIDLNYELRGCSNKQYSNNKDNNDRRKSVVFSLLYKYE